MPKHFYGKFEPDEFNESVGLLLGSGPYRMPRPEDWKPGTLIELRAQRSLLGRQRRV